MGDAGQIVKSVFTGDVSGLWENNDPDELPPVPEIDPPTQRVDISEQKKRIRSKSKRGGGRSSTILASLGENKTGKKTVLG